MEEDLEDGEVLESDDDKLVCMSKDTPPLETENSINGKKPLPKSGKGQTKQAKSCHSTRNNLPRNPSSSESDGSSSDPLSSEEDDAGPAKKKPTTNGSGASVSADTHVSTVAVVTGAKRARTKNNIWGSVLTEQTLSKEIGSWGVNRSFESDRDVESYDYLKAQEMAFAQREEDREQERVPPACENSYDHYESVTTDLCDIETFGTGPTRPKPTAAAVDPDFFSDGPVETNLQEGQSTSDRKLWRKRSHVKTVKGRLGVKEEDADTSHAGYGPGNEGTDFQHSGAAVQGASLESIQSRLGPRGYDEVKVRSHIGVTASDAAIAVSDEIMRVLKEPAHMKDTFMRIVEAIGAEEALKLLYKTEDLEEAGGLMTVDCSRRRTAGGVYLFLLKADHPREVTDVIFADQRDSMKRQWQEKKERQKRAAAERRAAARDAVPPLPDCKDVFLRNGSRSSTLSEEAITERGDADLVSGDITEVMDDVQESLENDTPVVVDFA